MVFSIICAIVYGIFTGIILSNFIPVSTSNLRNKELRSAVRQLIAYDVLTDYQSEKKIEDFIPRDMFPLSEDEEQFLVEEYRKERQNTAAAIARKEDIEQFINDFDAKREYNRKILMPPKKY